MQKIKKGDYPAPLLPQTPFVEENFFLKKRCSNGVEQLGRKSGAGFTLIELIVVMAIFLFIIGAALAIFISMIQHQRRVLSEEQILNQISYIEESMSKALRMAKTETVETCLKDVASYGPEAPDHTGYVYLLTRYDNESARFNGIKFINASDNGACQEFYLDTSGVLKGLKNSDDDNDAVALTPAGLYINDVRFSVNGSDGSATADICHNNAPQDCGALNTDGIQPRVTMLLSFKIKGGSQDSPDDVSRTIQTTVSQRNLNVQ